jgi:hypothetical protein
VGPVALPPELEGLAARVDRHPLVSWHELPSVLASVDVCLAPLFADLRFAAAKGEVKYLEAAAVSVPTVATATSAYRHAICDGDNGRLATTQDEWRRALDDLLRDPSLRRRLGTAARLDVVTRWTESRRASELLAIVDDVRGGLRRRARRDVAASRPASGDDVAAARVALEEDACPAFATSAVGGVAPPVSGGSRLVQRLRASCDGLVRVDVHAVTYGLALDRQLRLELRRDDGSLAGRATLPASELPDRAWVALELDAPERLSAGRVYTLSIAVDGPRGGPAPTFGTTAATAGSEVPGPLGVATLDDAPLAAPLALRGFAAWRVVLDELGQRDAGAASGASLPAGRGRAMLVGTEVVRA